MNLKSSVQHLLRRAFYGNGRICVGPGQGLLFDPGPSNPDYASGNNELPVQHMIARHLRRGQVFYDIGANVGFMSVIAARLVGALGAVYAFEPVPLNAEQARRNCRRNGLTQVHVFETAISNFNGTSELNLAQYSGGASLAGVSPPPDARGAMVVEVVTVDDLLRQPGFRPPNVVKIDVEGAEMTVLQGMERTVEQFRPAVVVEIDAGEMVELRRKQFECEQWLVAHGYDVAELPDSYMLTNWHVKHIAAL